MRRLFPALLALILCACSSDGSKADLVDNDMVAVDLDAASDSGANEDGGDVSTQQEVDQTVPPVDGKPEIVVVEGEFELFTTAPAGDIRAIWGSEEVLYAVGDEGVILRRQGTTWTPMKSPTTRNLRAIFGSGDEDIYAAGEKGTIIHWDGTAWEEIDSGLEIDLSDLTLNGIWGAEGQFYVVGDKGTILHYFEGKWKADDSLSSYNLGSIWGVSLTDIYGYQFTDGIKYSQL